MPVLIIDGRQIEVPAGTTVIQAAEQLGIFVPRYCYHPGLSVAGNCRICLVEVEKAPKLQIACNTPVAEGMVVHTHSDPAEEGRRAVLEFLLANHPLDCPVCDQSGECNLQNYYMDFGLYSPRFREQKVKKNKAVELGPHVMLDQERCILCSRCVRFTDEITGTGEFGIFNRGSQAELGLYPGDVLDNPYSANVVDICPVGALTERDFRFKARVWYLSSASTLCNGCSQGCNVDLHYVLDRPHLNDGARVARIKPRYNADVNEWWLCDEGRYGLGWLDHGRLTEVGTANGASGEDATWESALGAICTALVGPGREEPGAEQWGGDQAQQGGGQAQQGGGHQAQQGGGHQAQQGGGHQEQPGGGQAQQGGGPRAGQNVGVIASAQLATEELFLIREIFQRGLGATVSATVPQQPGSSDDFLIKADKKPNTQGAILLGLAGPEAPEAAEIVNEGIAGNLDVLWVFGHDLVEMFGHEKVRQLSEKVGLFIFSGTNNNPTVPLAHWVLPSAAYVEKDGTFVNCHGRIQRIGRALPLLGDSREDWSFLLELTARLGRPMEWEKPEEIFLALARVESPFAGLSYEAIGDHGAQMPLGGAAPGSAAGAHGQRPAPGAGAP